MHNAGLTHASSPRSASSSGLVAPSEFNAQANPTIPSISKPSTKIRIIPTIVTGGRFSISVCMLAMAARSATTLLMRAPAGGPLMTPETRQSVSQFVRDSFIQEDDIIIRFRENYWKLRTSFYEFDCVRHDPCHSKCAVFPANSVRH
jgi:hypothetical protein